MHTNYRCSSSPKVTLSTHFECRATPVLAGVFGPRRGDGGDPFVNCNIDVARAYRSGSPTEALPDATGGTSCQVERRRIGHPHLGAPGSQSLRGGMHPPRLLTHHDGVGEDLGMEPGGHGQAIHGGAATAQLSQARHCLGDRDLKPRPADPQRLSVSILEVEVTDILHGPVRNIEV